MNAVAPSALRTRLADQVLAEDPEKQGPGSLPKTKWSKVGATDPKLGAAHCVFLASAEIEGITGN